MRIIDADALREQIRESSEDAGFYRPIYAGFLNCIDHSPTITPESLVKRGEWEKVELSHGDYAYNCTVCGAREAYSAPFCRYCGAKMVEN